MENIKAIRLTNMSQPEEITIPADNFHEIVKGLQAEVGGFVRLVQSDYDKRAALVISETGDRSRAVIIGVSGTDTVSLTAKQLRDYTALFSYSASV